MREVKALHSYVQTRLGEELRLRQVVAWFRGRSILSRLVVSLWRDLHPPVAHKDLAEVAYVRDTRKKDGWIPTPTGATLYRDGVEYRVTGSGIVDLGNEFVVMEVGGKLRKVG